MTRQRGAYRLTQTDLSVSQAVSACTPSTVMTPGFPVRRTTVSMYEHADKTAFTTAPLAHFERTSFDLILYHSHQPNHSLALNSMLSHNPVRQNMQDFKQTAGFIKKRKTSGVSQSL